MQSHNSTGLLVFDKNIPNIWTNKNKESALMAMLSLGYGRQMLTDEGFEKTTNAKWWQLRAKCLYPDNIQSLQGGWVYLTDKFNLMVGEQIRGIKQEK